MSKSAPSPLPKKVHPAGFNSFNCINWMRRRTDKQTTDGCTDEWVNYVIERRKKIRRKGKKHL